MLSHLDQILYTPCYRSTKSYNMWNRIRKRTSLIRCPSCSVGEFTVTFHLDRFILLCCFCCPTILKGENHLAIPAFCSDWNGSKRGHVYKFLRSQGFVSSYDTAHQYADADAHKVNLINLHQEFRFLMPEDLASACFSFLNSSSLSYLNVVG